MNPLTDAAKLIPAILALAILISPPPLYAQDDAGEEAEAELLETTEESANSELEKQKKEAELRADIAVAEQKEAEANAAVIAAKSGESKGLQGTITLDEGAGYLSEILAYRTVTASADEIGNAVVKALGTGAATVVISNQLDMPAVSALWNLVRNQLELIGRQISSLQRKYQDPAQPTDIEMFEVTSLSSAIGAGLSQVADIFGYFREDTTLSPYVIELNDKVLMAEISSAIKNKKANAEIILPSYGFGDNGFIIEGLSDLSERRDNLEELLRRIKEAHSHLTNQFEQATSNLAKLKAEMAKLEIPDTDNAAAQKQAQIDAAEKAIENLKNTDAYKYLNSAETEIPKAVSAFDKFLETLTTPPKEGQQSPIERLSTIDALRANPDAHFLYVGMVGQGGEVQITKSIWTGGRVSYIGGSTSVFFLTDKNGAVSASGAESQYHKAWYGQRRGVSKLKSDVAEWEDE